MRFYTSGLMLFVAIAAVVFAVIREPQALLGLLVPLVGGVCVVLPVLGTIELFTPTDQPNPQVSWTGAVVASLVALVGCVAASALMMMLTAWLDI